jgi:hypothetical protein
MKGRIGGLLVGAGAVALAVFGVPAVTATAGATGSSATFTLTNTHTTVTFVGTTTWTPTGGAGPTGGPGATAPPGTNKLTPAAFKASLPKAPDVGVTVPRPSTIAGAPGGKHSGGAGRAPSSSAPSAPTGGIGGPTKGLTSVAGSGGYTQGVLHPFYTPNTGTPLPLPGLDVEPPDQGLCAGNGYVMEVNNMVVQVFTSKTMTRIGSHGMALERLFDAPEVFGGANTGTVAVQGDPRCFYDPVSNHWFASQIWLTEVDGSAKFGWAGEFVAASATTNPTGKWHVYFIKDQFNAQKVDGCNAEPPATFSNTASPANPCYGDQPLLGVNGNAVFISTNEYTFIGRKIVGGVASEYALSKADLINGTASPIFWNHLGDTVTRPAGFTCSFAKTFGQPTSVICPWYSIVPAVSDGGYVSTTGGTFYAASNVTFTTSGGHQVALWKFTNTDAVTTTGTTITGSVAIGTTVAYNEPPKSLVNGHFPSYQSLVPQENGTHPLGTLWKTLTPHGYTPIKWKGGEGMIATNTDRVATAAYDPATGTVWAAVNSVVVEHSGPSTGTAWFRVKPTGSGATLTVKTVASGYVSAPASANDFFPSIAFTTTGKGVMAYVISGRGYFPSTGYSLLGANGPTRLLHIARAGVGPEDGFSEYTPTYNRPRFGDYSAAIATGTSFFFATEMINQTCSVAQFEATFTCGGTRDLQANFGTSVNKLS